MYKIHVFKYSPRQGTKAAVMENQIDGNIKEERSNKLLELSDKYEKEFNEACIGKELSVLCEEQEGKYVKGHTTNYRLVKVKKVDSNKQLKLENEILKVKILRVDGLELIGTLVV